MSRRRPRALVHLACLVLAACGGPSAGAGASPASPSRFDPSLVRIGTDSFAQRFDRLPEGSQRKTLERTATGYRFTHSVRFNEQLHRTVTLQLDSAFVVRRLSSTASFGGMPASTELVMEGDRVRGRAWRDTPDGPRTVGVDTVLPPGTIPGEALMLHVLLLPWEVGQAHAIPVYEADVGTLPIYTLRVLALEAVTVPAGTFDACRGELTGPESPITVWVTQAVPRRLLKTASEGGETVLIR